MKWEYKVENSKTFRAGAFEPRYLEATLSQFGNEGWELVSVLRYATDDDEFYGFILKRQT